MGEIANRSGSTRSKYRSYFSRFCEWVGKSPEQLILQRKEDLKSDDSREQRRIESALKGFIAYLGEEGNSVATQQVAYAAIRSFFEMHYQPLRMRRGDYPRGQSLGSRVATKEDIRIMLEDASARIRAVLLFLKDTGLRVSDVVSLKYGDLAEGLEGEAEFISISLVTKKNKIVAKTFVGPESAQALKEYFSERRKGTRSIPPEEIEVNSPLFRTRSPVVKPVSRSGLSSTINFHAQKHGINGQFSAHSFRKYFQTQLEAAGINSNWIDQMIGHKLINSRDSYSQPTCEQLREAYAKAYQHLMVFKDSNVEARVNTLETQVAERDRIIESLVANGTNKANEIEKLQSKIEEVIKENSELKQRLNSFATKEPELEKLLKRLEALERKLAQNE